MKLIQKYSKRFIQLWIFWVWFLILDLLGLIVGLFNPTLSLPRWLYWAIGGVAVLITIVKIVIEVISEKQARINELEATVAQLEATIADLQSTKANLHLEVECFDFNHSFHSQEPPSFAEGKKLITFGASLKRP